MRRDEKNPNVHSQTGNPRRKRDDGAPEQGTFDALITGRSATRKAHNDVCQAMTEAQKKVWEKNRSKEGTPYKGVGKGAQPSVRRVQVLRRFAGDFKKT